MPSGFWVSSDRNCNCDWSSISVTSSARSQKPLLPSTFNNDLRKINILCSFKYTGWFTIVSVVPTKYGLLLCEPLLVNQYTEDKVIAQRRLRGQYAHVSVYIADIPKITLDAARSAQAGNPSPKNCCLIRFPDPDPLPAKNEIQFSFANHELYIPVQSYRLSNSCASEKVAHKLWQLDASAQCG